MKKSLAVITLAIIFTLSVALPAFAFQHEATYKFDGTIDFSSTAGHFCNTGAQMEQRISGQGTMTKTKDVYMEEGLITVSDNNDWVTAPDAVRNLTVTTAIKLCAPAKYTYDGSENAATASSDVMFPYDGAGNLVADDTNSNWNALTDQIWAVSVSPDPGFSGQLDMAFEAANSNNFWDSKDDAINANSAYNGAWYTSPYDDWDYKGTAAGPWFAGSYFNIEQFSRTSQGTHRRYIDISSPWNHGYLKETMTVVGMSEVWEAFSMDNLPAGDEVGSLWWELF